MRTKTSLIIDTLFVSICIGIVCFAWTRHIVSNLIISVAVAFSISFVIAYIILKISLTKNKKILQSNKDISYANQCFTHLSLNKLKCQKFFDKLFKPRKIIGSYFITGKKTYYINYEEEQLTSKDICKIHNSKFDNITILANNITESAQRACQTFNIQILSKSEVFYLMKQKNIYPIDQQKTAKNIKKTLGTIAKMAIERKKAKHYLVYGVLLLLISFIVPFTFMYCIMGTIFIIFGILCYTIKSNKTISK